jgi:hypothetical protein
MFNLFFVRIDITIVVALIYNAVGTFLSRAHLLFIIFIDQVRSTV